MSIVVPSALACSVTCPRADHPDVVGHPWSRSRRRRRPPGTRPTSDPAASSASSSSAIAWNGVCSPRNDARARYRGQPRSAADEVGTLLRHRHHRDVGVDRRQFRHRRRVDHPQPVHALDPQLRIEHRHRIGDRTHPRRRRRVIDGVVALVDVVEQFVVGRRVGSRREFAAHPCAPAAPARRSCGPAARRSA